MLFRSVGRGFRSLRQRPSFQSSLARALPRDLRVWSEIRERLASKSSSVLKFLRYDFVAADRVCLPLAQAHRAAETSAIEHTVAFAGRTAAAKP